MKKANTRTNCLNVKISNLIMNQWHQTKIPFATMDIKTRDFLLLSKYPTNPDVSSKFYISPKLIFKSCISSNETPTIMIQTKTLFSFFFHFHPQFHIYMFFFLLLVGFFSIQNASVCTNQPQPPSITNIFFPWQQKFNIFFSST